MENKLPNSIEEITLSVLEDRYSIVVSARREISKKLENASRKERADYLSEHRRIKKIEYDLSSRLAEFRLKDALKTGNQSKINAEEKRVKRLRSRLDHEDWLNWTRSIWKFKDMESDVRTNQHPAQFSSKIPHRLIRMFSFEGDIVFDPFIGTGTTCVEALLLGRNSIGFDVNRHFLQIAEQRVSEAMGDCPKKGTCQLQLQDARLTSSLSDSSVQLIVTHPPYWNCVKISDLPDDLSNCDNESYPVFLNNMKLVLEECFRVLQPDRVAAFMVGDVTRKVAGVTRLFPLHADMLVLAQDVGFVLWDIYVVETKMRNSGGMPMMGSYPYPHKIFAQFAHNYLLILRKST